MVIIPKKVFLTKGVGVDKEKLSSFELALRSAGIAGVNLVHVSSIFPPHCKLVPKKIGLKELFPGQIVFAVMSRNETNEPNRIVSASVDVSLVFRN